MRRIVCQLPWVCAAAALSTSALTASAGRPPARQVAGNSLRFEIDEGSNLNAFYRSGPVAAHMLLRSGTAPRILFAFPAGNSGVALWFAQQNRPLHWQLAKALEPIAEQDASGRMLHGVQAEVLVKASSLEIRQALLSSIRVLRDYETAHTAPSEILVAPKIAGNRIGWSRNRLDGAPGYRLSLEILSGRLDGGGTRISAAKDGRIRLKVRALTGETPLTPLDGPALLNTSAGSDIRARNALEFLSYREKFLAGSWRFDTYFGRDTLMSIRLLMPTLRPAAIGSGLLSVLERLAPNGEVSHEEDIGEFAVLRHKRDDGRTSDAPIYDYGMIDDDFMLAPVASAWLLDTVEGRKQARTFLARRTTGGIPAGAALVRNFRWVVERTSAFAVEPVATNLVGLKSGRTTGQWRDSNTGLAGGRYPYDVNAVFVPAALAAIARFADAGLLDPYLSTADRAAMSNAVGAAQIWQSRVPGLFAVEIQGPQARSAIGDYAKSLGIDPAGALASIGQGAVAFNALALDEQGRPLPVMHTDDGVAWLFSDPSPAILERGLAMMRPFPAGLSTDAGIVVANPVFASPAIRKNLNQNAYHGTVIWSWQQAVLAAGIARQLRRTDLPDPLRSALHGAQLQLWDRIDRSRAFQTSELWSWQYSGGRFIPVAFGAAGHADESNAAQLWSTVYLALGTDPRDGKMIHRK